MDTSTAWQQLFEQWPSSRPRIGIVIAEAQEPIAFTNFLAGSGILALERERPDTQGARKVLLAFSAITAVKFIDTTDFADLQQLGLE